MLFGLSGYLYNPVIKQLFTRLGATDAIVFKSVGGLSFYHSPVMYISLPLFYSTNIVNDCEISYTYTKKLKIFFIHTYTNTVPLFGIS